MRRDYGIYQVGLKALVKKGNDFLFLKCKTRDSFQWDLPGGRIDDIEAEVPLKDILAREMREEGGINFRYTLGKPTFQFRRLFRQTGKVYVPITVYEATYVGGEVTISNEHDNHEGINPRTRGLFQHEFFAEEEYLAFKKYFSF